MSLSVLVVDDEAPALDEVAWLLDQDPRIGNVASTRSATETLRILHDTEVDVVFLDINMPGLTGLELARVFRQFKEPPQVVFVTAHEAHAVEAFDLHAVDYVLKPVRAERLSEAVRRALEARRSTADSPVQIPVERGGVTRFIARSDVAFVEAQGDYARLHIADDDHASYLVRTNLADLEEQWQSAGFVRIHRSLLVALSHIEEVRIESGRCTIRVVGRDLGVSRRHTRELRDLLMKERS